MRAPVFRTRKYDAKIDADAIRSRILAHKASMVEQMESIAGELVLVESKAKIVCEGNGIPSVFIPAYLNFARQCYKYGKKFTGTTKDNEIIFWFNHWVSRGLDAATLAACAVLCGTTIPGY